MKKPAGILIAAAAVLAFWAGGFLQEPLLRLRESHRLDQASPLRNSPPLVTFTTVAIGGFRGILADLLWLRASALQEEGRFFELVQLSDWITKLEPRFSQVWAFHAWNMAYNVSILFRNPEDRWRWVRHGISLLRDEGLLYNPGDPQLHRELGWLFQHKIGGYADDANAYYKQAWAMEMMALFDGPRPDWTALAAGGTNAQRLIGEYKLDPARMKQVDGEYGPFDWRLPQAHAVYWASQALTNATGFEAFAAGRMILQSMNDAFLEGSLFSVPERGLFVPSANLDILPNLRRQYEQLLAEKPDREDAREAHRNFLREAVVILYSYNRAAEAGELFNELARRYPSAETQDGLPSFVNRVLQGQMASPSRESALFVVSSSAYQGALWEKLGDANRAAGFKRMAETCWHAYMDSLKEDDVRARIGLPPLDDILDQAAQAASDPQAGPELLRPMPPVQARPAPAR